MYTAAVLKPTSVELLKWIAIAKLSPQNNDYKFETKSGDYLPHHMTINLGALNKELNPEDILGKEIEISFREILINNHLGVCAAEVLQAKTKESQIIKSTNKYPHITICLKPNVKPVTSNLLFEGHSEAETIRVKLDKIYTLEAIVQEVY